MGASTLQITLTCLPLSRYFSLSVSLSTFDCISLSPQLVIGRRRPSGLWTLWSALGFFPYESYSQELLRYTCSGGPAGTFSLIVQSVLRRFWMWFRAVQIKVDLIDWMAVTDLWLLHFCFGHCTWGHWLLNSIHPCICQLLCRACSIFENEIQKMSPSFRCCNSSHELTWTFFIKFCFLFLTKPFDSLETLHLGFSCRVCSLFSSLKEKIEHCGQIWSMLHQCATCQYKTMKVWSQPILLFRAAQCFCAFFFIQTCTIIKAVAVKSIRPSSSADKPFIRTSNVQGLVDVCTVNNFANQLSHRVID